MNVTVSADDIGEITDHGSVVVVVGTTEDGRRVLVGVDHRVAPDFLAPLLFDDVDQVEIEIEAWQILGGAA